MDTGMKHELFMAGLFIFIGVLYTLRSVFHHIFKG